MSMSPQARGHRWFKTWFSPLSSWGGSLNMPHRNSHFLCMAQCDEGLLRCGSATKKFRTLSSCGRGGGVVRPVQMKDHLESQFLEIKSCTVPTLCSRNSQHWPPSEGQPPDPSHAFSVLDFSVLLPLSPLGRQCSIISREIEMFHYWNNNVPTLSHHLYDWMQSPNVCSLEHTVFLPLSSKRCHFLYYSLIIFQGKVESSRTHFSTELGEKGVSPGQAGILCLNTKHSRNSLLPLIREMTGTMDWMWASQVSERERIRLQRRWHVFDPWVRKTRVQPENWQRQTTDEGYEGRRKERWGTGEQEGEYLISFFFLALIFAN